MIETLTCSGDDETGGRKGEDGRQEKKVAEDGEDEEIKGEREERDGGGKSARSRKASGDGDGATGDCEDSTLGGHPAGHSPLVTATTGCIYTVA